MYTWNNVKMVLTVVALIVAAACTLFQEEVAMQHAFQLHINKPATPVPQFVVLEDVDTQLALLGKYGNSIEHIAVQSVSYTVRNYSGSHDAVISGDIEFAPYGSDEFTVLSTITDLHLRKMEESGQSNTVHVPGTVAGSKLAQLLRRGERVTFRLKATTAEASPVAASLAVVVNSKLTVAN